MATAFIGGGNMATALIGGMLARGAVAADFRVVEPYPEARAKLAARFSGIALHAACTREAIAGAALVVLAVKPQQMRDAARALAPHLASAPAAVVLSIAAGIRLADLARWLSGYERIVRAIPNTPALIGKGISGAFAAAVGRRRGTLARLVRPRGGGRADLARRRRDARRRHRRVGQRARVRLLLPGSARSRRARTWASPPPRRARLAHATLSGAVALGEASPAEPAVLRAQVTSKGGTTERAIASMEDGAVKSTIVAAVKAAAPRAAEMGDAFGRDD